MEQESLLLMIYNKTNILEVIVFYKIVVRFDWPRPISLYDMLKIKRYHHAKDIDNILV